MVAAASVALAAAAVTIAAAVTVGSSMRMAAPDDLSPFVAVRVPDPDGLEYQHSNFEYRGTNHCNIRQKIDPTYIGDDVDEPCPEAYSEQNSWIEKLKKSKESADRFYSSRSKVNADAPSKLEVGEKM